MALDHLRTGYVALNFKKIRHARTTKSLKSMVFGKIFQRAKELAPGVITPKNLHEYVYSLPVSCMLSGCETVAQIDENTAILENFQPMSDARRDELLAAVEKISGPGLEYYKNEKS